MTRVRKHIGGICCINVKVLALKNILICHQK
nr:MAG TPA: hypothetical protein [Caudoviricetes sp.]